MYSSHVQHFSVHPIIRVLIKTDCISTSVSLLHQVVKCELHLAHFSWTYRFSSWTMTVVKDIKETVSSSCKWLNGSLDCYSYGCKWKNNEFQYAATKWEEWLTSLIAQTAHFDRLLDVLCPLYSCCLDLKVVVCLLTSSYHSRNWWYYNKLTLKNWVWKTMFCSETV